MPSIARHLTLLGLVFALSASALPRTHAQWTVSMRAMQNPLPVGQCTAIEIVVTDARGATPLRPNGQQVDWQDFDLEFTAPGPEAFTWSNPRHRFLCAQAPIQSSATVIAHYPGAHLQPHERVPGVDLHNRSWSPIWCRLGTQSPLR